MARDATAVLQARAAALAHRHAEAHDTVFTALVSFALGGVKFAVPLARVRQAFEVAELTEIPTGPPYLVGVTTVAGEVVSILDLAMFLGVDKRRAGDIVGGLVVVNRAADRGIAFAAEELLGIEDVAQTHLRPVNHVAKAVTHAGSLADGDRLVVDVDLVFTDPRLT